MGLRTGGAEMPRTNTGFAVARRRAVRRLRSSAGACGCCCAGPAAAPGAAAAPERSRKGSDKAANHLRWEISNTHDECSVSPFECTVGAGPSTHGPVHPEGRRHFLHRHLTGRGQRDVTGDDCLLHPLSLGPNTPVERPVERVPRHESPVHEQELPFVRRQARRRRG